MEHLDKEHRAEACEYTVIGGKCCNLTRTPSLLQNKAPPMSQTHHRASLPEKCPHCEGPLRNGGPRGSTGSSSEDSLAGGSRSGSSLGHSVVVKWDEEDIMAWLREAGFDCYQDLFKQHLIRCGESLLALQEEHFKEMGVTQIGHRLELVKAVEELRKEVGLVSREKYMTMNLLMTRMNEQQLRHTLTHYPRRIILIRHGESEGNVDNALYAVKPDREMALTSRGKKQAYESGNSLKQLVQEESVCFYVSPFLRSRETYNEIRQSFNDEQVLAVREDPRIREQEWGNFQDPSTMKKVMIERRKVGSFYYRFLTGESGADVYDRVSTFLETLYRDMEKGGCGENAIIVSHGLFCRLFLMRYYHWKVEKFHKLWNFDNCQYAVMEKQQGGSYRLVSELKSDP